MALFACLSLRPGRKDPGLGDKPLSPNLHFDAFDPWVFGASSRASSCAWPACFFPLLTGPCRIRTKYLVQVDRQVTAKGESSD